MKKESWSKCEFSVLGDIAELTMGSTGTQAADGNFDTDDVVTFYDCSGCA